MGETKAVTVTGRIDVGIEENFGEAGKGYEIHAANDTTPDTAMLTYTQGNYEGFAFPPLDLSAGLGPSFLLTDFQAKNPESKFGPMRLDVTVGPYYNSTKYQSSYPYADSDDLPYHRFTGYEYGGQLRLDVTQQTSLPVLTSFGVFVQGRMGVLSLSGEGEDGSYFANTVADHTPGIDGYAAPLVGEIGGGLKAGPISLGIYRDTGANAAFNNLGYTFDQINADGSAYDAGADRPATLESGVDEIPSSLTQLSAGSTSIKVTVDLVEIGSGLAKSVKKSKTAKAAAAEE